MCLLAASYLTSCLSCTPVGYSLFCQTELEQEGKRSRESLCLPSYPFVLNEEDQKLLTDATGLQQIKLISFLVTTVCFIVQPEEQKTLWLKKL